MKLKDIYVSIRLLLAILWWHICQLFMYYTQVKSIQCTSEYFHKLVIIGDDYAAGLGDYITIGSNAGLARTLQPLLDENDKVRHKWKIINAGIPRSQASDWSPTSTTKKYYHNVFINDAMKDAEVVLVLLGSQDLRLSKTKSVQEILKHLQSICDTLRKKNKRVCLATVPKGNGAETMLNDAIKEYCQSTVSDDQPVICGPQLDAYLFCRDSSLAFDGYHFNSSAYKALARNTTDFLVPMLTAIEWITWKKKLSQVKYDKALYD